MAPGGGVPAHPSCPGPSRPPCAIVPVVVSRRVRRRRRQVAAGAAVLLLLIIILVATSGGSGNKSTATTTTTTAVLANDPLSPAWRGSGQPVTMTFGGDIHFEGELA